MTFQLIHIKQEMPPKGIETVEDRLASLASQLHQNHFTAAFRNDAEGSLTAIGREKANKQSSNYIADQLCPPFRGVFFFFFFPVL